MVNLIWDADGTLFDSYNDIINNIVFVLNSHNIEYPQDKIKDYILDTSTKDFFCHIEEKFNIDINLFSEYSVLTSHEENIPLMPHLKEVLEELDKKGINSYIFTHRGNSVYEILKLNNIDTLFKDVIDGTMGFKRKPESEAIDFLVKKYTMDKNTTFYIGDRLIDAECANNANIKMIFYQSYKKTVIDSSLYDYKIIDLKELLNIF